MKFPSTIYIPLLIILVACVSRDEKTGSSENEFPTQIKSDPNQYTSDSNKLSGSDSLGHIEHIRSKSDTNFNIMGNMKPPLFVDYVVENLLEKPEYVRFITDRNLLRKLHNTVCWDNYVEIDDTLSNGDKCRIEINSRDFYPGLHLLTYNKKGNHLIGVDGKYPFGAVYSDYPTTELASLTININGQELNTRIKEYQNLYEPEFCNFGSYQRITEAYEDGEFIYIYIFGGNAADSYFAKLIFGRSGYITSIICDYGPLSEYGSFGEDFIGF